MNNLSTVGVYLNALQQNVTGLSLGLKDLRKDIEELKNRQAPTAPPAPVQADKHDDKELEAVKARVSALEDALGNLQSIFSSLPPVITEPLLAQPASEPMDVAAVGGTTESDNTDVTDIELVPKAASSTKKKPAKKK